MRAIVKKLKDQKAKSRYWSKTYLWKQKVSDFVNFSDKLIDIC